MLNNELMQILKDNEELIEENKFEEFFDSLGSYQRHYFAEFFLLDVKIPIFDYMENLPERLFYESKRLKEIDLSDTHFKTIPGECFRGCDALKKVTLPEDVEYINGYAFYGTSIKELFIPSTVKEIGVCAFYDCTNLQKIYLSNTQLKEINSSCFGNCNALRTVKLPEDIEWIDHDAFAGTSIKEIFIPSTVKKIYDEAFMDCTSLKKIIFEQPSNLISIGQHAFYNCENLEEIDGLTVEDIETGKVELGWRAFARCNKIKNKELEKALRKR